MDSLSWKQSWKQYAFYRDQLLTFTPEGERTKWLPIKEIALKVTSGGTPKSEKAEYCGGNIPWLRTQDIDFNTIFTTSASITELGLQNSSAKWVPAHCVIVAMYGATAAKAAINEIALTMNQACCAIEADPAQCDYHYVYHWLASRYEHLKAQGEGSQANLNMKKSRRLRSPFRRSRSSGASSPFSISLTHS